MNELYTKYKTEPRTYEAELLIAIRKLILRKLRDECFAQELLLVILDELPGLPAKGSHTMVTSKHG